MMKEIEGKKLGMSQVFADDGTVTPVTLISLKEIPDEISPKTPVIVTGVSKGKGFSGVIKRWGFSSQPATRGQSDRERAPGSIGGTTTPGRVYKGKKMAGRMGGGKVTVKGLTVIDVDKEAKVIKVSGSIPGSRRGKITLRYQPSVVEEGGGKSVKEEEK